ncbi:hypothetical protein GF324_03035, partial [bacterium]|nr:hypothetical protein [bacterium]
MMSRAGFSRDNLVAALRVFYLSTMTKPSKYYWNARADEGTWADPPSSAPLAFHRKLPGYRVTPLRDLPHAADELEIGSLLVKDESERLTLP